MTRAPGRTLAPSLAAATFVGLWVASPAAVARPAAAPTIAPPPSAPASPVDRLEQLDQLHADLELAKLRAAIAKANAEARDAAASVGASPPGAVAGMPPLPQLGPGSPLLNLPPPAPHGAGEGKAKDRAKEEASASATFTLVEAWGAGAERQAVLHSEAGDRLVRVGDQLSVGVVTAIGGGAVTYRDVHGQPHTID